MVLFKREYEIFDKKISYKRLIWFVVCVSCTAFILIDFRMNPSFLDIKQHLKIETKSNVPQINKAYFVDTIACKVPSFNVLDDNIFQYVNPLSKIKCSKPLIKSTTDKLIFLMNESDLAKLYNITDKDKINCQYRAIKRKDDFQNRYMKNFKKIDFNNASWSIKEEFIEIVCSYEERVFYKDFYAFVKDKTNAHYSFKHAFENDNRNKLSVMILGIDGLSRLNFRRQMNTTATLLLKEFGAIELIGYNIVANNTYPNLVPVLTGLDQNELALVCLPNSTKSRYDDCPFIWKRFRDIGYQTVMAEDTANFSVFNFNRKGFFIPPTDYYLRPLFLEFEKVYHSNLTKRKSHENLCYGSRRPVDILYDYIRKLIPRFQTKDFFSFIWMSSFPNDQFNMPSSIDKDTIELFRDLRKSKVLNKTVIFLMSDQGMKRGSFRKTYQGMMEERQPLLYMLLPEWFKKRYSLAVENLQSNIHKLTTHFDLHSTISDLFNLTSLENDAVKLRSKEVTDEEIAPQEISLFLPVPESRTCENAAIGLPWCTCYEKQRVLTIDQRVQKAARFMIRIINGYLSEYPQCRQLYLNSIFEANISSSNRKMLKEVEKNMFVDVTVHIQTKPGMGEFEATVRIDEYDTMELTEDIKRANEYTKQGFCVHDYEMKLFCFCNR